MLGSIPAHSLRRAYSILYATSSRAFNVYVLQAGADLQQAQDAAVPRTSVRRSGCQPTRHLLQLRAGVDRAEEVLHVAAQGLGIRKVFYGGKSNLCNLHIIGPILTLSI